MAGRSFAPGLSAQSAPPTFSHLHADFHGVDSQQLRDSTLLAGLLVAAASAAGVSPIATPIVHPLRLGGFSAVLVLDGCHISAHTHPGRGLLLLDVLVPATHDPQKALEVFTRRLVAREIYSEARPRG